ncbi:MAG: HAD family phosphatase [Actinomycetota bacterium]|nr:HAD family phosphatase [Actinomycetota bacterium]
MRPRALIFDFNGTLSDDEPILCGIFQDLFAQAGRPMTEREYFDELAGSSDPEIVERWLGAPAPEIVSAKVERYRARVSDGSSVPEQAREAVRVAAEAVPVAVVSGAFRDEIEPVLAAAGLAGLVSATVTAEDVENGKPDPEGYRRGLELLGVAGEPAVAFEDSDVGIAAALAAGLRCVAVLGTMSPERLARAEAVVPRLDAEAVRAVLVDRG